MKASWYDFGYRWLRMPYDLGVPHPQVVDLVQSGRVQPCRCLELACGPGNDAIFLAQQGFEVTAIDFSEGGLEVARKRAARAGVDIDFRHDDATRLANVSGMFDLVLDCGSLSDLSYEERTTAYQALQRFLGPRTRFFIWCFEWTPRAYERWLIPGGRMSFDPGEVEERFADRFDIEVLDRRVAGPFRGFSCYLLSPAADEGDFDPAEDIGVELRLAHRAKSRA